MAISKTSTVNKALTLCGALPITNLTDDSNNARIANRVYEISRRAILSESKWSFALTRITLSVSAETMPWEHDGESVVYVRPADAVRVWELSDEHATFRIEGDLIISNTSGLGIKYVYDHDNPSKYPALFLDAFVDKLCSDIAFIIINSASKAEAFLKKYRTVSLPAAMTANAQTGVQQILLDDAWEGSKFFNGASADPTRSYG